MDADLNNSTRTDLFAEAYPDRFFNVGIAESNLVGVASGLASCGKQVWIASFAAFLLPNAYDQLRMSVAFPHLSVKVVGTHAGITVGEDGPSQMGVEDIALATALAGFQVFVPADAAETRAVVRAAAALEGPVYIRCGRPRVPVIYPDGCEFTPGQATQLREGDDVTPGGLWHPGGRRPGARAAVGETGRCRPGAEHGQRQAGGRRGLWSAPPARRAPWSSPRSTSLRRSGSIVAQALS